MSDGQDAAGPMPWRAILAFGLGTLRLSPCAFWSLTLPELRAALLGATGRGFAASAPDRAGLERLMRLFPDAQDPTRTDGGPPWPSP